MEKRKLQGQIAIVTGSSSGIGAGCAREMARAGATVVINYPVLQSQAMAEQIVAEIVAEGNKAVAFKADVSKEDEVIAMFKFAEVQFGRVDILVNKQACKEMQSLLR